MLGSAWLTLRQAQEALRNGRLEEAHRLLCQPDAQGHKGSWDLLQQVARGFLERGELHLRHADPEAAWNDLLQAEQIGLPDSGTAGLRHSLTRQGIGQGLSLLEAGEASRAAEVLGNLRDRGVRQAEVQQLEEAAKGWNLARDLAGRGEFSQALEMADQVARLVTGPPMALKEFQADLVERSKQFGDLVGQLHQAADHSAWREVLQVAEKLLAVAPHHLEARKARARAWKSIDPATAPSPRPLEEQGPPARAGEPSRRFLLWIDGVGGYLVCLGSRITLGQATPDAYVDVPLFADVSRMHAALTRDAEGYLLEGLRPVQVNGQTVDRAILQPGDRVTLGSSCQLQFTQPVPVSATAQLDLVSGHRLPLALERVYVMADTLVLGPTPQSHVVMPDLAQPIVLYRNRDKLGVRCPGTFLVDGQPCRDRGTLGPASRVAGDDFALAVEPVGARLGRC